MKNMKCELVQPKPNPIGMSEEYPYGLHLHLNEESIKKLGIDLPELGASLVLKAKVKVTNVSKSENLYGTERNIGLQITDMELGKKGE